MADISLTYLLDFFLESEEDHFSTYLRLHKILHKTTMLSSTLLIKKKRQRNARITNYAEAILPMYRMDDLRDRFQMNRHTFESLVIKLAPYLARGVKDGCIKINVEKQLLIYVKYVSTQITLQTIADIF